MNSGIQQSIFKANGPCWLIQKLVEDIGSGVVNAAEKNLGALCKEAVKEEGDYTGVGYKFECGYDCAAWLIGKPYDWEFMCREPSFDIECELDDAVSRALEDVADRLTLQLLVAWCWNDVADNEAAKYGEGLDCLVLRGEVRRLREVLQPVFIEAVSDRLWTRYEAVLEKVEKKIEENELERQRNFIYEDDDFGMREALEGILAALTQAGDEEGVEYIREVLTYVNLFYIKDPRRESMNYDFYINKDNGHGFDSVSFSVSKEEMSINVGGYFISENGGDSYGDEVWSIAEYQHANGGSCGAALSAINMIKHGCRIHQ